MDVSRKRRMSDVDDIDDVHTGRKRLATLPLVLRRFPTVAADDPSAAPGLTDTMMDPSSAMTSPALVAHAPMPTSLDMLQPPAMLTSRRDIASVQALQPALNLSRQDMLALVAPTGKCTDIVIEHTTVQDWQRVLLGIEHSSLRHQLYCNATAVSSFQHSLEEALQPCGKSLYRLHIWLGAIELRCYLADENTIEFDLRGFDVQHEHDVDLLMYFVQFLRQQTGKPALVGDASPNALYWQDVVAS